jgi:hypothetical protein
LFSVRRLVSCIILNALFVSTFYICVEVYRARHASSFRPPLISPHFYTNWPIEAFVGVFSISIARFILDKSITVFSSLRFATLFCIVTIFLSFVIVFVLSDCVTEVLSILTQGIVPSIFQRSIVGSINIFGENRILYFQGIWDFVATLMTWEVYSSARIIPSFQNGGWAKWPEQLVKAPLTLIAVAANSDVQSTVTSGYSYFSIMMFSYLRMVFALGFFATWALLRPAYRVSELVFRRVLEAEKGPLATLAVFVAALAKLIEILLR